MTERSILDLARRGMSAWQHGNLATVEAMLDPDVEWHWFQPGEWDCHGREDVMRALRDRYQQGFAGGELEFLDGGAHSVVLVAHPSAVGGADWPAEVATVITFRGNKVTRMQDDPTREEALRAAGEGSASVPSDQ